MRETISLVYRASNELLEKKSEVGKEKHGKILRKWCKENFINSRSLRHARDIHSQIRRHVEQMRLCISSCGDDTLQFRRCLAAAFFLNAALKQPEGTYRLLCLKYSISIMYVNAAFMSSNSLAYVIMMLEDVALASVSMRPIPFPPVLEKLSLSDMNYRSMRRFYINTQEDCAITIPLQEAMIKSNPQEQVFQLKGSDHAPFFSRPQGLHKIL
ncbi:hypothetical protein CRYUN_Cryun04dG0194400 [Craigia yunnanensis]